MADLATVSVRRQLLEVDLRGTYADGIALQHRLPDMCTRVLGPALEAALAELDPGDAYVIVERLEVDLGRVSLVGLDDELGPAVRAAVEDFLRNHRPAPPSTSSSVGPGVWSAEGDMRQLTANEAVDEALVHFLATGRLPWAFRLPAGEQLEDVVRRAWSGAGVSRGPPPSATRAQLLEALNEPTARARLVMQFSSAFATTVLKRVSPSAAATLEACLSALPAMQQPTAEYRVFVRQLWDEALVAAVAGRGLDQREAIANAWQALPDGYRSAALRMTLERLWPDVTGSQMGGDRRPMRQGQAHGVEPRSAAGNETVHPSPVVQRSLSVSKRTAPEYEGEVLLVGNAGCVLLHPFLPRFLEGLGVAEGDELVDSGRALCLLHCLATGAIIAPEHELTLPKVLCNVGFDEPVEADIGITDDERDEATAVLEAAIGHWGALGNSSPDALRGEFLMRPGVISGDVDGGWLLRVEARTVDVLLDQLPWGVSMIRLPWMHRMLRVEWR